MAACLRSVGFKMLAVVPLVDVGGCRQCCHGPYCMIEAHRQRILALTPLASTPTGYGVMPICAVVPT